MFYSSTQPISESVKLQLTRLLIGSSFVLLAVDPVMWLARSWQQAQELELAPFVFLLVALLMLASRLSPLQVRQPQSTRGTHIVLICLTASASFRLLGHLWDINLLSALLLPVDIFVIGKWMGLQNRRIRLDPFWLAVLFCFCLPVELVVQRAFGFLLQQLSACVAYFVLWPWFSQVALNGVQLLINDIHVLVDLPCSGAQLLTLLSCAFTLLNVFRPVSLLSLIWRLPALLAVIVVCNGLRISLLATGIVHKSLLQHWGVDVMAPVEHDLIGLFTLSLGLLILFWIHQKQNPRFQPTQVSRLSLFELSVNARLSLTACLFSLALCIGAIQPQPMDASHPLAHPSIPMVAAGFLAKPIALTDLESTYFKTWGGNAARATYGPFGLLLVATTSPLRHLHDPAVCFRGMGYTVDLQGTNPATNTTLYQVVSPEGEAYQLAVSYVANDGTVATSIAEVVHRWLWRDSNSPQRWLMVQRIVPQSLLHSANAHQWQASVMRRFNITGVDNV